MGLTKDYQKFVPAAVCNIVASQNGVIHALNKNVCVVSACESLNFYNLRTREIERQIRRDNHAITTFAFSPDNRFFAIGYDDGEIHLYDQQNSLSNDFLMFSGHKTGVNTLAFSHDGFTLASGGKDCVIIIWDVLSETGKFRLNGHTNSVTQIRFTLDDKYLISSSKDTQIRFWDLSNHSCFYTIFDSAAEVYGFVLLKSDRMLVIASAEVELVVYELTWLDRLEDTEVDQKVDVQEIKKRKLETEALTGSEMIEEQNDQGNLIVRSKRRGGLIRQANERAIQISLSSDETIITVLGGDLVDVFRVYSDDEAKKRLSKKLKRARKRLAESGDNDEVNEAEVSRDVTLFIARIGELKSDAKIKWLSFSAAFSGNDDNTREYRVVCIQNNNAVYGHILNLNLKTNEFASEPVVDLNNRGHRREIRSLVVAASDDAFITGSEDCAILWNLETLLPTNRLEAEGMKELTAALFAPGDKFVIFGSKNGSILIFELATCELVKEYHQAHSGAIWSLSLLPDKTGFVSVGSDKMARFWEFELVTEIGTNKVLRISNSRSTELEDEILCSTITPNGKFIIFGLLNFTAKVHYLDSMKFFLSLYGHSLPVMCVDTDVESKMLVTGSSDKGCKIWSLDFGDCRRSLYGHTDAVTAVKFNRSMEEKLFFSAGKDGRIIQWDGVKFHKIQVLEGHKAEIRTLALAMSGKTLISTSHDKTIRIWEESEDLVVLGEQETAQIEEDFLGKMIDAEDIVPGESADQDGQLAAKKSVETIKGTETILEAVDILRAEKAAIAAGEISSKVHPLIKAYGSTSLEHFILDAIHRVRNSILEKSLLMVPFGYVPDILLALNQCIKDRYRTELATRIVMFLLKIHHNYIIRDLHLFPMIQDLRMEIPKEIQEARDLIAFNGAALKLMKLQIEERDNVKLFRDISKSEKTKKKRPKERTAL
uniref:Small-subunit processome Utp12 domain-containing protein n=1 Tax=Panagrolaimus sp. JU765 TaxID=591449 RepID=A0AC34RRA5_9BILA